MRARLQVWGPSAVAALCALASVAAAHAEHAGRLPGSTGDATSGAFRDREQETLAMIEAAQPRPRQRRVRFSNGPRAVPRARGAAFARALALGIGDHLSTKQLLWSRPSPELLAAVPGERPRSLLWPVVGGKWGRGFGFTRKVRTDLRHNGIDIGAKLGTPVRAAAPGLVLYSDNTLRDLGNAVMILHPGGWTTLYGHNLRNTVQAGWYVQRGERIALVGQTGAAWGPHVHFELRDNGRWRDPAPFITGYRDLSLDGPLVELGGVSEPEPEAGTGTAPGSDDAALLAEFPLQVGSLAAARQLLRSAPPTGHEQLLGRKFSNLLWPIKAEPDTSPVRDRSHALVLPASAGTPVRVAADGLVIYSGAGLRGYGHALVVLHRNGWVTVYGAVRPEGAAEPGTRLLRGEWIGRVAEATPGTRPHLRFEWLVAGRRQDPRAHFAGR